jgi:ribosomal protein S18 acetylase RimI-like enzyme
MTESQFDIRRLSDCPLTDAVDIWNLGFQGYFADMTLTVDGYLARLHNEELSQEFSFLAYCEDRPAGFLLNGIRHHGEVKVAWNGGTGVSPEFRKQGVGRTLVQSALELYAQENVALATLEAISTNQAAISLYQSFGYELIDRLTFLHHEGKLAELTRAKHYQPSPVAPAIVGELDFYRHTAPWQTQWRSLAHDHGEAVIIYDAEGVAAGYALFKKRLGEKNNLESVALYQCEVRPRRTDANDVVAAALEHVYGPLNEECRRTTNNLSLSNEPVIRILREAGFVTFVEQVQMALALQKFDT